jgi:CelD/BcsL family acetyltransferase involved in cellulose biosynthesis
MAATRRVRIDRLKLAGTTIAIQFGLVSGNRYFLITPTFDERWASASPGYALTYEAIKQSIAERLESYEFLGSEDAWKLHWTSTVRATRTWAYYPYSIKRVGAIWRRCRPRPRTQAAKASLAAAATCMSQEKSAVRTPPMCRARGARGEAGANGHRRHPIR